jgi:maleylacetoacetate isomerase
MKGIAYEVVPVHLRKAEHQSPAYQSLTAEGLVPVLEIDGLVLTQSLSILEYLEERQPDPALLPGDAAGRARVRALAQIIACEIHPLNNLRVLKYLSGELSLSQAARDAWYAHWVREGLTAFERQLALGSGLFCHGDRPSLADCVLLPQVFNARITGVSLDGLDRILEIEARMLQLTWVRSAYPFSQPDAEGDAGALALPTLTR